MKFKLWLENKVILTFSSWLVQHDPEEARNLANELMQHHQDDTVGDLSPSALNSTLNTYSQHFGVDITQFQDEYLELAEYILSQTI